MQRFIAALSALLILGGSAEACSWFSPCKPKILHHAKPKPDPRDIRLTLLEKRITELEAQVRAYGAAFATHQAEIHALKAK